MKNHSKTSASTTAATPSTKELSSAELSTVNGGGGFDISGGNISLYGGGLRVAFPVAGPIAVGGTGSGLTITFPGG